MSKGIQCSPHQPAAPTAARTATTTNTRRIAMPHCTRPARRRQTTGSRGLIPAQLCPPRDSGKVTADGEGVDVVERVAVSIILGGLGLLAGAYFYFNLNARVMSDYRQDFLGGFGVALPLGLALLGVLVPWVAPWARRRGKDGH